MRFIAFGIMAFMLVACASLNFKQEGARTAMETATIQYIDGQQKRAKNLYKISNGLIEATQKQGELPVKQALGRIEEKARDRISWGQLSEAEALVIHRLIDVARAEIEQRIKQGSVNESTRVAIVTVLEWVRDIARLSGGGNGIDVESMGGNEALAPRRKDRA